MIDPAVMIDAGGPVPAPALGVAAGSVDEGHRRAAAWPYAELDIAALRASGWRPTPVREFILKIHQRCNLACDYCYVYESADQSWRDRPAAMPVEVRQAAVAAIGTHVRRHELTRIRIVLHGGEPLLYGLDRIAALIAEVRAGVPATCAVEFGMQTNAVLLTAPALVRLRELGVVVGVSVDGVEADHDRHRVTRAGKGSFASVSRALGLLRSPEYQAVYGGLLCTVSPESDPIACYEQLLAFAPPLIDFLLPHANWAYPPSRPAGSPTAYADWLIAVFDRWYDAGGPMRVRIFEDVINLLLGGPSRSEQAGLSPAAICVVESDGALEQVDALKSTYAGACATGLNVLTDDLDRLLEHPGVIARQIGVQALSDDCLACPIHRVCGGGHYAHRYAPVTGFRNTSAYCADMQKLINYIWKRLDADVRRLAVWGKA
ncbi:FxsB family cyclophane-forming radical SAM/SPASM peptide maturase [Hamadaea tsunoensis]|uniref:FxsB family cyclophane-forming radical SAM/SPASM peptide maturase n=1 Tax=Hamadaea tsunoensis TaxID=53368 RepID=UPI00041219A2|nr:FxsB family cyclophane-forming radical SAM/SPASM peptide maturase [Hamadaea tsunoensis]